MLSPDLPSVTLRPAHADDAQALTRLAALDSSLVPDGPLMVAEVNGELRVALSTKDSTVIADPFHRTVELVDILRAHTKRSLVHGARVEWTRPTALLRRLTVA